MLTPKKIVIAGGGFAGVKTALELANRKEFDVTLLSPRTRFEYHGAMYRSATGKSPLEVVVPLSEIFADAKNVSLKLDSVAELRPDSKEIEGESGTIYHYDSLVIAVGYVVNFFNIPGMAEYAETLYSISEAIQLRHRLVGEFRNADHQSPVKITVIGAGPTGVEVASDIRNFAMIVAGKHGIIDLNVDVTLVEAAPRVLAQFSEEASSIAADRLIDVGVKLLTDTRVTSIKPGCVTIDESEIESDVIIWTAGNKANPLFGAYPDLFTLDKRQRVVVNEHFQANDPHVCVIGDAASTPHSGMAQTAIHNALWLADNFKRSAEGELLLPYEPKQPEYVVPIGGEWALLQTDSGIISGKEGWLARREADKWALENFLAYDIANHHFKHGERLAHF